MSAQPENRAGWSVFRYVGRFRAYGRPYIGVLLLGVFLRIGEMLADLAQPWPLAIVVDSVLGSRPLSSHLRPFLVPFAGSRISLLTAAVVAGLVLAAISAVFDYLGDRVMNGAGERITAGIRTDLFGHLQRLPLSYHDRNAIGELVSRISVDTGRIEDALVDLFSTLLPGVLNLGGLLVTVLLVSWQLGLIALAFVPIVLFAVHRYSRLTREAARVVRNREGRLSAGATETLAGIKTVHVTGRHDLHDAQFGGMNTRTLQAGLRAVDLRARFTPIVELCTATGASALLWLGAWGVMHGLWTLGMLLVVLAYVRNMVKPIRSLSRLSVTFSRGAASAERVAAVLDAPLMGSARRLIRIPPQTRVRGAITLEHVSFTYGRKPVLTDANLSIRPGERVAVTGANGIGKSTLVSLICRLYVPDSGRILLDGAPLESIPPQFLRSQFAVVPQETFLFSGTLWDNIVYGRPSATPAEVLEAARHARVTDFVKDLPDGFGTYLGDRGVGLSGGQRQRIAIARALLRNAPVVLLDEPTSGLDLDTELQVVDALEYLMRERTVIMVTHRPALLRLAQRVVTLSDGAIVESAINRVANTA